MYLKSVFLSGDVFVCLLPICYIKVREAAKKLFFLVAWPLKKVLFPEWHTRLAPPPLLVARPLRKEPFFYGFPYINEYRVIFFPYII